MLFSYLYKDCEENDHDCSCDEESLFWKVIDEEDQGETDGSSQATVGNNKLIPKCHHIPPEFVYHSSQQENA